MTTQHENGDEDETGKRMDENAFFEEKIAPTK